MNPESVPSFTVKIVDNDEISIQNAVMGADVIIYSIAEGEYIAETQAALDFIQQEASHFTSEKMFILVSFCLTWNKTKPLDIDDPEIPFTEDDYRLVFLKWSASSRWSFGPNSSWTSIEKTHPTLLPLIFFRNSARTIYLVFFQKAPVISKL